MTDRSKNQVLETIGKALNQGKTRDPDFLEVAGWAESALGPGPVEDWETLFALDPETREALLALREYPQADHVERVEIQDDQREVFSLIAQAGWSGSLRIGYSLQSVFRVTQGTAVIHLPTWMNRLYRLSRQMLQSDHTGIWPSQRVEFAWPDDQPVFRASVRIRQGTPVLTLRWEWQQVNPDSSHPIEVEYWRGRQWVGSIPLSQEDPETEFHLKPGWPYLFCARTSPPCVLKLTCGEEEISPAEWRMAILLRVLMGDISGGFGLFRQMSHLSTPAFRWLLAVMSRCLPEQSLEAGYAPVRDALVEEEVGDAVSELFRSLARGWLARLGHDSDHAGLSQVLSQINDPFAQGFLLAIQGNYEEALDAWLGSRHEKTFEVEVAGACFLAFIMIFPDKTEPIEIPTFVNKELDAMIQCLMALRECRLAGIEDLTQLAQHLRAVCQLTESGQTA